MCVKCFVAGDAKFEWEVTKSWQEMLIFRSFSAKPFSLTRTETELGGDERPMMKRTTTTMIALGALALMQTAPAQDTTAGSGTLTKEKADQVQGERPYSPYANRNFPSRPFFGDTHLHTGFSMDAGAFGCTLTPRDALRFARGEQVTASSGQPAKLSRPLDFLVVADHSDNMGFFPRPLRGQARDPRAIRWAASGTT